MAKKKEKAKTFYVLESGERFEVTGENGKYYFCENGVQFRRASKLGHIEKVKAQEPEKAAEPAEAEKEGE